MSEKVVELTEEQIEAKDVKKAAKLNKITERLLGYKMRELQADDIFKIVEMANKLDVTDLITEFLAKKDAAKIQGQKAQGLAVIAGKSDEAQKESLTDQIKSIQEDISAQSFDLVGKAAKYILSHSSEIQIELNSFLADLTGKTTEEIGKTPLVTYALLVKSFFSKPELREVFELLS
ncbi:MAG: hypothetical protein LKF42_00375 [Streptococcaceae bacterium]|jgi:hypothetical protein|nr:hypothetical protein [Streptococcaceae bacterium]MCH4176187.1 hypothetical protein [Streptococcaceae bacterium]